MPDGNVKCLPANNQNAEHKDGKVTQAKAGQGALHESEERYRTLFEATDSGFCILEMIFDEDGRATDYRFVEVNPAFERQSGLVDAVGRRIREFAPDLEEHWFERYGRVARTGEPMRVEGEVEPLGRWFDINAFRVGAPEQHHVAVLFQDITERKHAEAALRTSEEQFESLLNQAPLGVYLVDADFVIRQVNPVALPAFGDIPGGPIGRDFGEVIHILWDKAYADEVVSIFRHTLDTGEPYVTPERAEYRADRDVIEYYEWRIDRISLPGGQHGVVCYFRDISAQVTARKEIEKGRELTLATEERHALLLRLSDAIRWLTDPVEIMAVASEMIGKHLDVGRAGYCEIDGNNEWFVVERDWTDGVMTSMAGRHRVADFGPASVAAHLSDQAFIVEDAPNDPRLAGHQAALNAIGVEAGLLVPLVKDGRWIAAFFVQESSPRRWTAEVENLIRDVVGRTWAAVERARAEAALRESESRLRAVFDSVDQGYMEVEVEMSSDGRVIDWQYVAINPSFERLTGMEDVTGRLASEVFPDREPEWAERYAQVVTTGEPIRFELTAAAIGRWFDINLVNVGGAGSRRIAVVYDDITERKRADLVLRESERHQSLLLAELQHRVRNILAMVQSVARRSVEGSHSAEDYARHLVGRLAAMARTQSLLTRSVAGQVDLQQIVRDELMSVAASEEKHWCEGPDVALPPKAAEVLTLAIHELSTNSVKYGALSAPGGQLEIRWNQEQRDGQRWLLFKWEESRVRHSGFKRQGFGTELITRRVPHELRGKGSIEPTDDGMIARIEFPLVRSNSILETSSPEQLQ